MQGHHLQGHCEGCEEHRATEDRLSGACAAPRVVSWEAREGCRRPDSAVYAQASGLALSAGCSRCRLRSELGPRRLTPDGAESPTQAGVGGEGEVGVKSLTPGALMSPPAPGAGWA